MRGMNLPERPFSDVPLTPLAFLERSEFGFRNRTAYVDADSGGLWARVTPRHRQQLALGGAATLVVGVAVAAGFLIRRHFKSGR